MRDPLDLAIQKALNELDDERREHFKAATAALLAAYVNENVHALIVLGESTELAPEVTEIARIIAINTTDIVAAQLANGSVEYLGETVMEDAPPREMFN